MAMTCACKTCHCLYAQTCIGHKHGCCTAMHQGERFAKAMTAPRVRRTTKGEMKMVAFVPAPKEVIITPQRVGMLLDEVAAFWEQYGAGPQTFQDDELEQLLMVMVHRSDPRVEVTEKEV